MKIAIIGPDGSGKTSIIKCLSHYCNDAIVIYGGKRNFKFFTTMFALSLWRLAKRSRIQVLAQAIRFFIYYPLEFVDNLHRFRPLPADRLYLFDRHPIDRMIMVDEFISFNSTSGFRRVFSAYPFLLFWNFVYRSLFPINMDMIYFILPEPKVGFQRAKGQYPNIRAFKIKVEAYRRAAEIIRKKTEVHLVDVTSDITVKIICDKILESIAMAARNDQGKRFLIKSFE